MMSLLDAYTSYIFKGANIVETVDLCNYTLLSCLFRVSGGKGRGVYFSGCHGNLNFSFVLYFYFLKNERTKENSQLHCAIHARKTVVRGKISFFLFPRVAIFQGHITYQRTPTPCIYLSTLLWGTYGYIRPVPPSILTLSRVCAHGQEVLVLDTRTSI